MLYFSKTFYLKIIRFSPSFGVYLGWIPDAEDTVLPQKKTGILQRDKIISRLNNPKVYESDPSLKSLYFEVLISNYKLLPANASH